jgi:hypothetical protein
MVANNINSNFKKNKFSKAQGSIEYLLIIGVIILVVAAVAIVILGLATSPGLVPDSTTGTGQNQLEYKMKLDSLLYSTGNSSVGLPSSFDGVIASTKVGSKSVSWSFVPTNVTSPGELSVGTWTCESGKVFNGSACVSLPTGNTKCSLLNATDFSTKEYVFGAGYKVGAGNWNLVSAKQSELTACQVGCATGYEKVGNACVPISTCDPATSTAMLGDGTSSVPYQVTDCCQLQAIGNDTTSLSKSYILMNDIQCLVSETWNSGAGFRPIGTGTTTATAFTGTFSGNKKSIFNLRINRPTQDYVGLFGSIVNSSGGITISDLYLVDVSIVGRDNVGSIVGIAPVGGTLYLDKVSVTGNITGNGGVGGLVGYFNAFRSIQNSYTNVIVTGNIWVGGLVGSFGGSSSINYSYSIGTITAGSTAGGLVGAFGGGSAISNSYSLSKVNGSGNSLIGGVLSGGTLTKIYWDSVVSGQSNCYSVGNVGCTSTANNASAYYGANGIPFTGNSLGSLGFSTTIWQSVAGGNPVLK